MKKTWLLGVFLLLGSQLHAQLFLPPVERFSGKKPGYLITTAGEKIEFELEDLDRKKGLIYNVEGKRLDNGKKFDLDADQIAELALAPSDYAKFASFSNSSQSVLKASKTDFSKIDRSLIHFYQAKVEEQKKTTLLQLLNQGFDSKIKVYHDPFAAETMGLAVGGIQVTGGLDKSYYITANGKTYRLKKKNYDNQFKELFGNCPAVMQKYGNNFDWRDLESHVLLQHDECK